MASSDPTPPLGPDEIAFRLDLTEHQMKVTWHALKAYLDDFGHEYPEIHAVTRAVLEKLPDEHAIRAIQLPDKRG